MWRTTQKIVLSLSLIVLFVLYAMQRQAQPSTAALVAAVQPPMTATVATISATASATATAIATAAAANTAVATRAASTGELARVDQAPPTDTAVPPTDTAVPPTATASGAFKDGTYDGGGADAHWGTVEVQAVITNGQISNVVFVQYPNHRNRSQEINSSAMPMLTQEAIQAQDSNVDIVSGATDTSEAFIQSLSAALQQAAT